MKILSVLCCVCIIAASMTACSANKSLQEESANSSDSVSDTKSENSGDDSAGTVAGNSVTDTTVAAAGGAETIDGNTSGNSTNATVATDTDTDSAVTPVLAALTYPDDYVKTIKQKGMTVSSLLSRTTEGGYDGDQGDAETGLVVSPYYTVDINGTDVPAYATPVYVGSTGSGALHSYSMVDVTSTVFPLNVEIHANNLKVTDAIVLPASSGIVPAVGKDKVTAAITAYGIYTFLVNNASQQYAFTLFVREYVDEDAEIQSYINQWGADHVTVYDAGVHHVNYINLRTDNSVIYLKRGALLVADHKYSITNDTENQYTYEDDAEANNELGLKRYSVINCYKCSNIKIMGRGTIDFGALDWHERRGIVMSMCNTVELSGITLINCPEWSIISYRCTDLHIDNVAVFGYRTNSDAFAICNTQNGEITDCFARSGDDLFEVKTLGGDISAVCRNVTFTNCVAWEGKARCFGITGEVNRNISDIAFKNCAVIYRDATWDNNRLGSLAIIVEEGNGKISNITFENIEIFHDYGRAINITVYNSDLSQTVISNVTFHNITYTADMTSQLKTNEKGTNSINAVFSNTLANGVLITSNNFGDYFNYDSKCEFSLS